MRIAHVVASIDDPNAGPSYSVVSLARSQARLGADVEIHAVAGWRDYGSPWREEDLAGVRVLRHAQTFRNVPIIGAMCCSSELARAIDGFSETHDIIHAHGLWLMPNVYPGRSRRAGGKARLFVAPRGMLGEAALRFSSAKKRAMWLALQRRALAAADRIHATAESERDEVTASGIDVPVIVVPNGVDLPASVPAASGGNRTILSLGRVHPKKGLDLLVRAWAAVAVRHPGWRVRIVGPDEGNHADELRSLIDELDVPRITVEDAVRGEEKERAFREAGLFVLPSRNENFAMSVAEALSYGVPVVSTRGAPWVGLEEQRCGWWVAIEPASIAAAIDAALTLPDEERAAMGARGRDWISRDFSWPAVARAMMAAYAEAVGERRREDRAA